MTNSSSSAVKATTGQTTPSFAMSWIIWTCAATFFGYQFLLRVSPSVMADDLIYAFKINECELGFLTGSYYLAYASLQIPLGSLIDYFKPRRIITMAAIVCAAGAFIFSNTESYYVACFGRGLIGAGSAVGFLSALKLGTVWFPAHRLPLVVGMTLLLGISGAVFANAPMAILVEATTWRYAIEIVAFCGFLIAALAWLVVRDTPPDHLKAIVLESHGDKEKDIPHTSVLTNIIEVATKPQSWLIGLYGFLMYVPLSAFADQWGTPFFIDAFGYSKSSAIFGINAFYIGIGIGAPLFSFLTKYLKAYKPAILFAAVGSCITYSMVIFIPGLPYPTLLGLLFIAGLFLGGQFLAFTITCDLNPLSASATAGGFHNMICMTSGFVFQPLIGYLLRLSRAGHLESGASSSTYADYLFGMSSVSISLLLACCIVFFIKESYSR